MVKFIKNCNLLEKIYFVVAFILITLGFVLDIKTEFHILNLIAYISALVSLVGSFLNMKLVPWCMILYAVASLLYGISSLMSNQIGEAILNIVYLTPVYSIAVVKWAKHKESSSQIQSLSPKFKYIAFLIIIAITVGYGFILSKMGSKSPFLNALATATIIFAGVFTSRQMIEQWPLWIVYSIVLVIIWALDSNLVLAIQNGIYVLFNLYSMIIWIKIDKKKRTDKNYESIN